MRTKYANLHKEKKSKKKIKKLKEIKLNEKLINFVRDETENALE